MMSPFLFLLDIKIFWCIEIFSGHPVINKKVKSGGKKSFSCILDLYLQKSSFPLLTVSYSPYAPTISN